MATPQNRKGMARKRFGTTGKPIEVSESRRRQEQAGKGRLYEDGSYAAKSRDSKKSGRAAASSKPKGHVAVSRVKPATPGKDRDDRRRYEPKPKAAAKPATRVAQRAMDKPKPKAPKPAAPKTRATGPGRSMSAPGRARGNPLPGKKKDDLHKPVHRVKTASGPKTRPTPASRARGKGGVDVGAFAREVSGNFGRGVAEVGRQAAKVKLPSLPDSTGGARKPKPSKVNRDGKGSWPLN